MAVRNLEQHPSPLGPVTRKELIRAITELFEFFEWDAMIECEEDNEGFPPETLTKRIWKWMCGEVIGRAGRIGAALILRDMKEAPPLTWDGTT